MAIDVDGAVSDLVRKYRNAGDELAGKAFPRGRTIEGDGLLTMLGMHMWNELYLGVLPPSRELELLQDMDALEANLDLFIRLSDQIRDEVKHSKLFSRRIEELGGNPNILDYEPTDQQRDLLSLMIDHDDIVGPAATLQVASEAVLARIFTAIIDREVVDRRTREVFRQSELDEGNHINNGKEILRRFAATEADLRRAEDLGDDLVEHLYDMYRVEYEPLEPVVPRPAPS